MATKRNKCVGCKDRFIAVDMIVTQVGKFCTDQCRRNYGIDKADKIIAKLRAKKDKEHTLRKKVFYASDLKTRKEAAQTEFNRYIRLRDDKEPCISCQKHHTGQYHAGHFKTTKARSELRFTEDNCHKQCAPCNNHLSGNIEHYRPNLIKKIGRERFDKLTDYQESVKLTCDDYKEIEVKYKDKLKQLMG